MAATNRTEETTMARKSDPTVADKIRNIITRYVHLSDEHYADVLALYVLHTHAFDNVKVTPYIYINSAERGSGKTTLLEVLEVLCRDADMPGNMTAAAMYAKIEHLKPTLLIDEVDAIWAGAKNEDMRGMLNTGYKASGKVTRNTGMSKDPDDPGYREFSTFSPKVLAGINNGMLPDTIMDRSIVITLKRANTEQFAAIEDFYPEDIEDELNDLQDEIAAWYAVNREALSARENRPPRIDGLGPRQNQIATPLLTVASRVGNGWFDRCRDAMVYLLSGDTDNLSPQAKVLLQIRDWFHRNPDEDKIKSATVAEITEHTGKQIGIWLAAWNIKPGTYTIKGANAKGYRKSDFTATWAEVLPDES
jgi:hypothetical protein